MTRRQLLESSLSFSIEFEAAIRWQAAMILVI